MILSLLWKWRSSFILRFILLSFLKLERFGYNNTNGDFVIHHYLRKRFGIGIIIEFKFIKKFLHAACENCHGKKWLKLKLKVYIVNQKRMNMTSREFMIPCIKQDGHYFKLCIQLSIVLKQSRKSVGLCQTFSQIPQERSDKTIRSSKTIV